jgi:hypothetical protein
LQIRGQLHDPALDNNWIRDWEGPGAGLGDMKKRKFFPLTRLEIRSFSSFAPEMNNVMQRRIREHSEHSKLFLLDLNLLSNPLIKTSPCASAR